MKRKETRPMRKKKTKAKVLGFFEYDDIPDVFLPSSSDSTGSDPKSDVENHNPDWFAKSPKKKKRKKEGINSELADNVNVEKEKSKVQANNKSSKLKVHKVPETDKNVKKVRVTRKRKLAPSSPEKDTMCPSASRKSKRNELKGTALLKDDNKTLRDKRIKAAVEGENFEELSVGFSPSQLKAKQTSTPAQSTTRDTRRRRPGKTLTEILSPLPKVQSPSAVCDFSDSKSERFGRSYTRTSFGGLKKRRKRGLKTGKIISIFGNDDDESEEEEPEEEEYIAASPKKTKKMKLMQQKEERLEKWAAELNAEFSDIEQHELCVENT